MAGKRDWPTGEQQVEWAVLLQAGDEAVWKGILDGLARPIAAIISRKDTRLSRDDLASETMMRLWKMRCLYSADRGSLRSFVYVVARCAASDMLRQVGAERPLSAEVEASLTGRPSASEPSASVVALVKALNAFTPREREIVLASAAADGTAYAEDLAAKYGIPAVNVRVAASRLRVRLRETLNAADSSPPPTSGEDSQT